VGRVVGEIRQMAKKRRIKGSKRRPLEKNRSELTGMSRTREGALAMLRLRAISINGEWDDFQEYRREKVTPDLYPNRQRSVENRPLAA